MALLVPDFLQTKTYSAKRFRQALSHSAQIQEGVWATNDYKVVQRAAGANMSVDVGAGFALVNADDASNRGLYHEENDATVNVTPFAASHATLPRLDKVIIQINDSTDGGDLNDTPALSILTGTPTAGTTLDNGNDGSHGAPAVPTGAMVLADVLIPATSTSVVTANIRDRRQWARGAYSLASYTGATLSTTSATNVEIVSTISQRIECSGVTMKLRLKGVFQPPTSAGSGQIAPWVDGAQVGSVANPYLFTFNGHINVFLDLEHEFAPAAGSHTLSWAWATSGAQTISLVTAAASPLTSGAEEVVRPNANNN